MWEQLFLVLNCTDTANNNNQISGKKGEAPSVTPNKKTSKTGEDIYSNLVFKCILIGGTKLPQCVICLKTLSSESLNTNK